MNVELVLGAYLVIHVGTIHRHCAIYIIHSRIMANETVSRVTLV